jgi:low temperature requirement protein LtrA
MSVNMQPSSAVAGEHAQSRRVSWLELFYDLVYVATIIQLGNVFSHHVSWIGFFEFVALFLPVWWSWMGVTFYANRFLRDDVRHRSLIFIQMFAVAALAINIPTAFAPGVSGFALAYVGVRIVLVLLFLQVPNRAGHARPLARHYAIGFSLSALIWLVAAFVPMPLRYGLWIVGMLVDFLVPLNPATRRHVNRLPPGSHHMMERFALFTMIVLGESFVKVVGSLAGGPVAWSTLIFGALGLAIAGSLWWLYFDNIPEATIRDGRAFTWIYAHLPLVVGITTVAVAMNKVVLLDINAALAAPYRWLFCGAVALCLGAVALINAVSLHGDTPAQSNRLSRAQATAAGVVLLPALAGDHLSPLILVGLVAALCVTLVSLSRQQKQRLPTLPSLSS